LLIKLKRAKAKANANSRANSQQVCVDVVTDYAERGAISQPHGTNNK